MAHLPPSADPRLLVAMDTADDAGVYLLTDDLALINTVDFFTPIVDDPYTFGAIAIANALSDVYAMGGTPKTAMNILFWNPKLDEAILEAVLRGGADMLAQAGCALVGGHSVEASELMFGAAVSGIVSPQAIVRNSGAQPGDRLILTKPLGVGVLTTAARDRKIDEADLEPAIRSMLQLNDRAGELLRQFGAHAATDITGYGLVGHSYEMALGSQVALLIDVERVPLFPNVEELIQRKRVRTRAPERNRRYAGEGLLVDPEVPSARLQALLEAETSGGLLIAVAHDRAEAMLTALRAAGYSQSEIVGSVAEAPAGTVHLRWPRS
ncbi:MAG: selenide, water dikinase [Candidatus Poribacteria bacterium]|nr:MAG: selenide, water dikinase [Candidatus Poribacteria bacterium]